MYCGKMGWPSDIPMGMMMMRSKMMMPTIKHIRMRKSFHHIYRRATRQLMFSMSIEAANRILLEASQRYLELTCFLTRLAPRRKP